MQIFSFYYLTVISGLEEEPGLVLIFMGVPKPNGWLLDITKISLLPGVLSCHVTKTLLPAVAIWGAKDVPGVLLIFIG